MSVKLDQGFHFTLRVTFLVVILELDALARFNWSVGLKTPAEVGTLRKGVEYEIGI